MKGQKTTNFFAIGAVTVIVIAFLSCQAWAETKSSVKHNQVLDSKIVLDNGIYKSPVFETDTEFNLVGLAWRGSDEVEFSVRFNDGDKWSQWYSSEADDFIIKEDWHYNVEPVITEDSNKIQYSLQSNGPVEAVKIHLINTTKKNSLPEWNFLKFLFGQAVAESELNIISRSDWKADEEWRLDGEGEKIWPVEHAWPAKFVIHHTAGSDGGDDPGATIRGIYYWHGVVLGWGDIGYNYLIDQQGNIYEGRYGGDGTIGAHAYRSKSCAKQRFGSEELEADFNKGTIGISVLGDYENSSLALSKKVKNALAELIGHKAAEFEIIPKGESFLIDDTYPNIVGHRDLDCTDCPGIKLYNKLEDIRNLAQEVYLSSGGSPEEIVKATYIDQSEKTIEINAGETREFWVEFRNDGNIIWRNYAPTTLQVVAKSKAPGFYLSGAEPDVSVATLTTPNVAPNEIGRFVFTIQAPEDKLEITEEFAIQFGNTIIKNTNFTITAQVSGYAFAGVLDNQDILPATFTNGQQTVTIQFMNRGREIWHQDDVKLNIYDLGYEVSKYYDSTWPDEFGQINFQETEVGTNSMATFKFKFFSPAVPGLYKNIYKLVSDNQIVQEEDYSVTRVDSMHQAELVSYDVPPAVLNVWRFPATVSIKNTGITTWDRNTLLKVYDLGGQVSRFKDPAWLDNYTAARLNETSVKPGDTGTFEFYFRSPHETGLFYNRFELVSNNSSVYNGSFIQVTRVDS